MNGIHDMGGMQGLGELGYEQNEPVFHAEWEKRLQALYFPTAPYRPGMLRLNIERIPAADYLRLSYNERRLRAMIEQLIQGGFITQAELDSGRADPSFSRATSALTPQEARARLFDTPQSELDIDVEPRFRVGDHVRGRNIHPAGHTRMPRYTRGKTGIVERDRGVFALPDNEALGLEPKPQHVYLIRFTAREVWGETAPARDFVLIDLWEDYLEPA